MRRYWILAIVIILCISLSGCTQLGINSSSRGPPVTTTIPTQPPAPRYSIGDILKSNSEDNIGKVVIDYNIGKQTYTVRSVIFDEFGRIYYIKEQKEQSIPFANIESSYPYKAGHIDNTYGIAEISYNKPKFSIGSIHREEVDKNNGIIILSYDLTTDEYTYAYAYYEGGGNWNYDSEAKHAGDRTAIEAQYKK